LITPEHPVSLVFAVFFAWLIAGLHGVPAPDDINQFLTFRGNVNILNLLRFTVHDAKFVTIHGLHIAFQIWKKFLENSLNMKKLHPENDFWLQYAR